MITKGLDFPNVSLAGILNADSALYIPDFRAGERTFQLIAQMAGRTGRGAIPGDVYVQTQTPEAPAIKFAATENFEAFAAQELKDRKDLDYPPYSRFICITLRSESNDAVSKYAELLAAQLSGIANGRFRVLGPAPAPLERIKKFWRHQISIFTNRTNLVLAYLREAQKLLPPPNGVSMAIDIDAMNMM
jgi:primosomal protein N' (replication factor Y)